MAYQKPTRDRPLLVGVLADVSGSMLDSMGDSGSRLESFKDSLQDLADRALELSSGADGEKLAPLVKLFAYGFGFGNVFTMFAGKTETVRDLLGSTTALDDLARDWSSYERRLEDLSSEMAGATPMLEGFRAVLNRFVVETSKSQYTSNPVLFVLSDGMPSEGTGTPQDVLRVTEELKRLGVLVVSCYVTHSELAEPRRLYAEPRTNWPEGARLMFECASVLEATSEFEDYLLEYDWNLDPGCKLFTQINQSEILSEFTSVVLSPLREDSERGKATALSARRKRGTVFISYSHRDKKWLQRLQVYLRPMAREGLIEVWDDTRIAIGSEWKAEIRRSLDTAAVAILIVTADFLASDFIATEELPRLLDAATSRGLTVLPIVASAVDFNGTPSLARYQAANSPDRPLNSLRAAERDRTLVDLARRVRALSDEA